MTVDSSALTGEGDWNPQKSFSNSKSPSNLIQQPQTLNESKTSLPQNTNISPNVSSPVITPNQQLMSGPPASAACGISPANGKWNYCLLAPMNGLIGDNSANGTSTVEVVDISLGIRPFFAKMYRVGVTVAVGLAIIMISFGGIQLATTDSISGTDAGRKKINAAFLGLFIALFSYVLLYTINPELVTNGAGDIFQPSTTVITP